MNLRFVSFLINTLLLWESRRSPALETESNKKESVAEKITMICVFLILVSFVDMMQPEIIEIKRMKKKICHILFEKQKLTNYPFLEFIILKNQTKPTLMEAKLNIFEPPKKKHSHIHAKQEMMLKKATYIYSKITHNY
uniref:(northern house mosquito) hypothetical protein n=1 Tax=Culex pipiens TaxID=7175 RepID=A0A8D8HJ28_CULPI